MSKIKSCIPKNIRAPNAMLSWYLVLAYILINLSRYLNQETANWAKGPFRSSNKAATYYYQLGRPAPVGSC